MAASGMQQLLSLIFFIFYNYASGMAAAPRHSLRRGLYEDLPTPCMQLCRSQFNFVEMSCVTGGTTRDFPVATNRRQPNCVAPICQARFASGQKILFCPCSALSPCSHFVLSSTNTRFYSNKLQSSDNFRSILASLCLLLS